MGFSPDEDLFFWRSPKFGQKNRLNFSEDLSFFFGDHLNLDRKTIRVRINENLGQDCLMLFPASKTAPLPPIQIPGYEPGLL